FDEIVYDLDTQQIVDFRLKPWADQFIILRAALYETEDDPDGGGTSSGASGQADAAARAVSPSSEAASEPTAPMGHIIPLAFISRGSLFFRQFSLDFLGQFRIFVPVELHPHDQEALNPRLELEALNPPRVEVDHHLLEDVLRHALAVFVVGHVPQP